MDSNSWECCRYTSVQSQSFLQQRSKCTQCSYCSHWCVNDVWFISQTISLHAYFLIYLFIKSCWLTTIGLCAGRQWSGSHYCNLQSAWRCWCLNFKSGSCRRLLVQSEIYFLHLSREMGCVGAVGGGTEWLACSVTLFSRKDVSRWVLHMRAGTEAGQRRAQPLHLKSSVFR